jgi:hypothetical protein
VLFKISLWVVLAVTACSVVPLPDQFYPASGARPVSSGLLHSIQPALPSSSSPDPIHPVGSPNSKHFIRDPPINLNLAGGSGVWTPEQGFRPPAGRSKGDQGARERVGGRGRGVRGFK